MEKVLSGKPVASLVSKAVKNLILMHNLQPHLRLIQVGNDPASNYYVSSIMSIGEKLGCTTSLVCAPNDCSQTDLVSLITSANSDEGIHGIMLQKPLPQHIDENLINSSINPQKDLDTIHPVNLGKIMLDEDTFLPCTPAAVYYLMRYYGIDPIGRNLVIVGRSNVVGKPLANMMLWKRAFANATVTVCHSKTVDLGRICANADILVAAIGRPDFITSEMIRDNSILIDVGINERINPDGKSTFVGDIHYNSCFPKCMAITPVPGGIGRITTSVLFFNLVKACLMNLGINKTIDEYIALIFNAN